MSAPLTLSDIDECSTSDICGEHGSSCDNTPGSYNCTCNYGYRWEGPGTECEGETYLLSHSHTCLFLTPYLFKIGSVLFKAKLHFWQSRLKQ